MRMTLRTTAFVLLLAAGLSACSGKTPRADASTSAAEDLAAVVPGDTSLPDALDNAAGLQTVAEALKTTGLGDIFAGKASYTLLAPSDDAFAAAGDATKAITGSTDQSALAALLKAHILPGYVTRHDIAAAIEASGSKAAATMTDMAGTTLTFTKTGDVITVTAPDGSTATLSGDAVAGKESLALPVDAVLKKL
ncbi:fasciclin domain-containing protein [Novosphingobium sp. 9]|uniref:fasciclin domain-containing protein n=1 Tax=Novosphingobium sp. 9 TaxID=2025349 RepID=UPI0021B620BD|nr:fasciclin domain-containing protein [Novosphingobium sp. 9]